MGENVRVIIKVLQQSMVLCVMLGAQLKEKNPGLSPFILLQNVIVAFVEPIPKADSPLAWRFLLTIWRGLQGMKCTTLAADGTVIEVVLPASLEDIFD